MKQITLLHNKFEQTTPKMSQHVATGWPSTRNMLTEQSCDMLRWNVAIVWPRLNERKLGWQWIMLIIKTILCAASIFIVEKKLTGDFKLKLCKIRNTLHYFSCFYRHGSIICRSVLASIKIITKFYRILLIITNYRILLVINFQRWVELSIPAVKCNERFSVRSCAALVSQWESLSLVSRAATVNQREFLTQRSETLLSSLLWIETRRT